MAVALVACSAASAEPGAPPGPASSTHPAGWQALPAIASAVATAAAGDGAVIDAVDAWGEPAMGCYAVWLELHGGTADAPALADQVMRGLPATPAFAASEVVMPASLTGVLAFAFSAPPFHGHVRAQLGAGRIAARTCFATAREPIACNAACARVLQGVP